jgi:hypothetical protein
MAGADQIRNRPAGRDAAGTSAAEDDGGLARIREILLGRFTREVVERFGDVEGRQRQQEALRHEEQRLLEQRLGARIEALETLLETEREERQGAAAAFERLVGALAERASGLEARAEGLEAAREALAARLQRTKVDRAELAAFFAQLARGLDVDGEAASDGGAG